MLCIQKPATAYPALGSTTLIFFVMTKFLGAPRHHSDIVWLSPVSCVSFSALVAFCTLSNVILQYVGFFCRFEARLGEKALRRN